MRIIYHHRTQARDAQGIHIREIIRSLRVAGHEVQEISLVSSEQEQVPADQQQSPTFLSRMKSMLPNFARELMEVGYNIVGFAKLWRAARRIKPDFIYERYALFNASGVLLSKMTGIPILLEVNSPLAQEQSDLGEQSLGGLARWFERWICSHATRVIVVSTPLKKILLEMGVPESKVLVLSNGVNSEKFHGRREAGDAVRHQYGLEHKRVVGFVGWVREWHGLEDLVRGMPEWPAELSDVHLLVIGDGPARESIEQAAREYAVADRVHVSGAVAHEEIVAHLAAIDVALQPAATTYASPMKIFEYLAMGKPVVGLRQENIEEILTEGENALLFTPGDRSGFVAAVQEIFSDRDGLQRMSQAARQTIFDRDYLWDSNAAKVVSLAEQVGAGRE